MNSFSIFKIAALSLFLGRGWLYLSGGAPLRTLLWSETFFQGFVTGVLGLNWHEYATNPRVDAAINYLIQSFGVFFIVLFVVTIFIKVQHQKLAKLYYLATGLMFVIILLRFAEKFFYIGMLIEHAIQIFTPLVFYFVLRGVIKPKTFILFTKTIIALTFVGHALFAVGFHPVPGNFIDMIISILGVEERIAVELLLVAGSIDIVASILLFVKDTERYALFFMIFWGMATALARVVANFNVDLALASGLQWIPETITRFPHALIPLGLYLYLYGRSKQETSL